MARSNTVLDLPGSSMKCTSVRVFYLEGYNSQYPILTEIESPPDARLIADGASYDSAILGLIKYFDIE
jgi:hypothetical protein